MNKFDMCQPRKVAPAPHLPGSEFIKKKARKCYRCGEMFVSDIQKQMFCPECRGWMGSIKLSNWQDQVSHGAVVTSILEDMRK